MPKCRTCGCTLGCDTDGYYIEETGEFVCDGCFDPNPYQDKQFDEDAYDLTDRTDFTLERK